MRKFFGILIGGIQQKIFNLVLIAMILITGIFMAISVHQYNQITDILGETSEKQLNSIDTISSSAMESMVRDTLQTTARLEAEIADGVFSSVRKNVIMLAEYVGKVISAPESYPQVEIYEPDPSKEGVFSAQVLFEEGVKEHQDRR